MKKTAIKKEFFVSIRKTMSRFVSIILIVTLGVAFFAGVRASEPDMRLSADKLYDESCLMDIRVIGTMGLTDDDVKEIKKLDGVLEAMPSFSSDLLCSVGETDFAVETFSLPDTINKIAVVSGRLPENKDECLVDSNFMEKYGFEIGDTITFKSPDSEKLTDTLKSSAYKIVGYGDTSYYISSQRDSVSIGTGESAGFIVLTNEAYNLDYYSDIYILVKGAKQLTAYTDEYDELVDNVVTDVENISEKQCGIRYQTIFKEAEEEITKAEKKIKRGENKLSDAESELDKADTDIIKGYAELENAKTEVAENKQKLTDAQNELNNQEKKLNSSEKKLNNALKKLQKQQKSLSKAETELEKAKSEIKSSENKLAESRQELERNILLLGKDNPMIISAQKQLEQAEKQLQSGKSEIQTNEAKIKISEKKLNNAKGKLEKNKKSLEKARKKLNSAKKELENNKTKLSEAEDEILENEKKLNDAEQEYKNGKSEYESEKNKNQPKLDDAKKELREAKKELYELKKPEWYVLDRQYLETYVEYGQNADRVGAIGRVFPAIFFLVAALVSLTTITRMVEEERTQIGTLKALGYSKFSIAGKYVAYALLGSIIGSITGLILGQKFLPVAIIGAYRMVYSNMPYIIAPIHASYSILSSLAAVVSTVGAAFIACYNEMRSVPAQLMRPEAPKSGKRILIERIGFLWKHFNFSAKSTARNIFRYKKRFFMTVFGIGGCMSLLIVGFGLKDSIASIASLQYDKVHVYDTVITFKDDLKSSEKNKVLNALKSDNDVESTLNIGESMIDAGYNDYETSTYLIVPETVEKLESFINLNDRVTGEHYELDQRGVIISEKLSRLMGVSEGDKIFLRINDQRAEVKISHIAENYFFHYIYMTPDLYRSLLDEKPEYNQIYINNTDSGTQLDLFTEKYLDMDQISSVLQVDSTADRIEDMLKSLDSVIFILVLSAGLLAFIVLYNLNNINISERKRELATLKVLGFTNIEVSAYVFRENIWLTFIGILLGLGLGKILHGYIVSTAEIDMMMFGRNIDFSSFMISLLITFMFSLTVNFVMHFKLKRVDMVESMKSVE